MMRWRSVKKSRDVKIWSKKSMTAKTFPVNIAFCANTKLSGILSSLTMTKAMYWPSFYQNRECAFNARWTVHNARKYTNYRRINQKTLNTWKHTNILHTETYWKKTLDTKHTLHRQQLTVKRKSTLQFADKVQWVNCKFHNCWWKDDLETTLPMGHYNGRPRSQRLVITIIIALAG